MIYLEMKINVSLLQNVAGIQYVTSFDKPK